MERSSHLDADARQHWHVLAISLLAPAFVVTVAITLLWIGPFAWHMQQPAAWQGGLESLGLLLWVFTALQASRLPRTARWLLLALPVPVGYLEGFLALGTATAGNRLPARYEHLSDALFAHWMHDDSGQHLRQVLA